MAIDYSWAINQLIPGRLADKNPGEGWIYVDWTVGWWMGYRGLTR